MNANPWRRLSDIVYARMDYLGFTQSDLEVAGGPTGAWVRRLKAGSGKPSTRHAKSLRQLSLALGWDEGAAWSLLTDDRSQWSAETLESEEHDLIYGPSIKAASEPGQVSRPVQAVRALTRLFQSDDPIPGMTDAEWDELLSAIEARREQAQQEQRRASGH